MLTAEFWRGFFHQVQHYLFIRKEVQPWLGHNPLAMSAMGFMYALGTVFMVVTGFALYGEGLGMESWAFKAFSSGCCRCSATARTCTRCTIWACGT
jgi:Ni/Fe-hydrogenase 1 B-type cytochrome subunit